MKNLYKKTLREDQYKTNWDIYPAVLKKINLEKGDKILDAGCGTGELLKHVHHFNIYGLDQSDKALKKARLSGYKKVVKAEITEIPFKKREFDKSICIQVFQYLKNPEEAIRELNRVTKKTIIITIPNFKWLKLKSIFIKNYKKIYDKAGGYVRYTDSNFLKKLAKQNNLNLKIYYISNKFGFVRNFLGNFLSSEIVGVFSLK